MKKTILFSLTMISMILLGSYAFSQTWTQAQKDAGQVPIPQQVVPTPPVPGILPSNAGNVPSGTLKVPLDGSFTQVYSTHGNSTGYYNDDGYTDAIPLQFTFCFYGTNETHCFINNNGNVSFNAGYSSFTSTGFPVNGFPMLAPFWADVDTRPNDANHHGDVWYKSEAHRFIVIWNNVGYYNTQGDKRNTFELIFTDGTDPLIGVGNNVAFSYTTMQWTTGSASGGVNGFGGTPATVGINKGDGVKYALVGRFDHAGADYDGPGGNPDGIGYLTDKYFAFDACQENPVISNIPISPWAVALMCAALLAFGTFYIVRMKGLKTVKA